MDDEFDNFLDRVTEVERLVTQMRSSDSRVADDARQRADVLLGTSTACSAGRRSSGSSSDQGGQGGQGSQRAEGGSAAKGRGDGGLRHGGHGKDRTVINQKAFDRIGGSDPAEMSKECFMAQVERDAENRARDRRERRQRSDELRRRATDAFREKHFERALNLYSQAIEERRDSAMLYENRALTCLNLNLYQRTVDDCDWALRLDENSLKALLYKAKALHRMEDKENSDKCIKAALEKHPHHKDIIKDYMETWSQDGIVQKETQV